MKFKKIFAAVAACAVVSLSAFALSVTTIVNAEEGFPTQAYLSGQIGGTNVWEPNEATAGSTIADVNGDAQYEVEWKVTDGGTDQLQFLMVWIPNVTTDQFPNMSVKIDAVYIDGNQVSNYTTSANAVNMAYYEQGKDTGTRLYLIDTWTGSGIEDIAKTTAVTQSVKVLFTISGTGITGTSNVTNNSSGGNNTTPTQAPSENNNQPTQANNGNNQTTQAQNNNTSGGTSGGAVLGNSTQTTSASTGDAGVAAAVAGLVITTGIGITAVALRRKK